MHIYKTTGNDDMCLGSGGCNTVIHSRYSEVTDNLTVPLVGMIGFGALLIALLLESRYSFFKTNGTILVFGMALTGFLFTIWLIYVELVEIKAICPFCVTTQITMIIIFILSVTRLLKTPPIAGGR